MVWSVLWLIKLVTVLHIKTFLNNSRLLYNTIPCGIKPTITVITIETYKVNHQMIE